MRNFDEIYVLIYCNEHYEELQKIMKLGNLPAVKNDLANARAAVSMMSVKPENVFEMVDSSWEEI